MTNHQPLSHTALNQEERIDFWAIVAAKSFKRSLIKRIKNLKIPLSFEMYLLINALWQQDGQSRKTLGLLLRKTPRNISDIANKLYQRELISVVKVKKETHYYLTPQGRSIQTQISQSSIAVMDKALKNISADDREICVAVLKRMFLNLELDELKEAKKAS